MGGNPGERDRLRDRIISHHFQFGNRAGNLPSGPAISYNPLTMQPCIDLRDVSVVYPNGVQALSDVSLTLDPGDFAFVVGPTGHGKSTLLKLLYAAEFPTRGQALVSGEDIARLSSRRIARLRRRVGVVFQDFRLLAQRTAWENVAFALHAIGVPYRAALRRVARALDEVGLLDKADRFPPQLSAGEQQRLALARVLGLDPAVILADEPTGNLDPRSSDQVIRLLEKINDRGTTVIVATHDPAIVSRLRRRVIALREGRIVSDEGEAPYPDDLGRD